MHSSIQEIVGLLKERPTLSVGPQVIWNERLDRQITSIPLTNGDDEKRAYEIALKGAFLIYNDSLSKGHDELQDRLVYARNDTASYWHGIMHRKEGDYNNAKHWCPSNHPIHVQLLEKARAYVKAQTIENGELKATLQKLVEQSAWNARLFVDIVKDNVLNGLTDEAATLLANIQQIELELLLDYTCEKAVGKTFTEIAS
ncbi:hypothetical protein BEP19_11790 [Ammoniphilus oxalaticus]|uniref:Uncharacterized protein n=1 Tax=Ammoniphilus oxalaticus TaxID=66863 RepID=A0A419SGI8_9BACL|nr:hypothetical protein [Ammoniphilus oxalaticus]RKD22911.1 hypothetical protein BEP19_11790 [Ammoniphilus oxalaticus]